MLRIHRKCQKVDPVLFARASLPTRIAPNTTAAQPLYRRALVVLYGTSGLTESIMGEVTSMKLIARFGGVAAQHWPKRPCVGTYAKLVVARVENGASGSSLIIRLTRLLQS